MALCYRAREIPREREREDGWFRDQQLLGPRGCVAGQVQMQRKARKHKGSSKVPELAQSTLFILFCREMYFSDHHHHTALFSQNGIPSSHGQPGISAQNKGSVRVGWRLNGGNLDRSWDGLHGPLAARNFGGSRSDTVCSKKLCAQPRTSPRQLVKLLVGTRLAHILSTSYRLLARGKGIYTHTVGATAELLGDDGVHEYGPTSGFPTILTRRCILPACRTHRSTNGSEFRNKNKILHS